jgi:hypothetical protein
VTAPATESLLAAGYGLFLVLVALGIDALARHSHRRSELYRTGGFTYFGQSDHWECPEGEHLHRIETDVHQRLARYRAPAHVCNSCPRWGDCTESDTGREVTRMLDPWPHSEAGRFHRGLSLMLVALALLVIVVGAARNHAAADAGSLLFLLAAALGTGRWLLRDFREHPSGFPEHTAAHGLRLEVTDSAGRRAPER